jgi:hypothetical protein
LLLSRMQMDAVPQECLQLVRDFARGWEPTPSARAMQAFWRRYPWVPEMHQLPFSRGALLYRAAESVGTHDCYKCNCCYTHRLYDIRVRYEPELADEQDRLWS